MDRHLIQHAGSLTRDNQIDRGLRSHMSAVYSAMSFNMLITAATAWLVKGMAFQDGPGGQLAYTDFGRTLFASPLGYVIMFAPLVILIGMGAMLPRMSAGAVRNVNWAVSALIGASMATILARYTGVSVASTFLATAAGFAGLSLWGYTTNKDLSGWGAFLLIGLLGIIIASIINLFVGSGAMAFAISVIGILIFSGLTAYDTQRTKSDYLMLRSAGASVEEMAKSVHLAALNLYLNFINLFQFLLGFMGSRD